MILKTTSLFSSLRPNKKKIDETYRKLFERYQNKTDPWGLDLKKHRWYFAAREVTVSDLYAFNPDAVVSIDPFMDLLGRHFKQPAEGLGNDNSPVAHMWRTMANPDAPL